MNDGKTISGPQYESTEIAWAPRLTSDDKNLIFVTGDNSIEKRLDTPESYSIGNNQMLVHIAKSTYSN